MFYIQKNANILDTDQTAPWVHSDLGLYCLQRYIVMPPACSHLAGVFKLFIQSYKLKNFSYFLLLACVYRNSSSTRSSVSGLKD